MYHVLSAEQRRQMVAQAIAQLEASRFEAELNATMSDHGMETALSEQETAGQRIARLDRQIARLLEDYQEDLRDD
jgi:hypothetical protein